MSSTPTVMLSWRLSYLNNPSLQYYGQREMLRKICSETSPNLIRPMMTSLSILLSLTIRKILRTDERILTNYQNRHGTLKLHIGCGEHILDGWLNSDLGTRSREILHLNATWQFPFNDDSVDLVFSEHMIEHITYLQGQHMLSECFRVLKPNGKVRVATPDLAFLVGLYQNEKSELQNGYIQWFHDNFIGIPTLHKEPFVINFHMRLFGHQFIYDEQTLRESFGKAGFVNITKCTVGESAHEEFTELENEAGRPPGFLRLASLVLEGTKP